MTFWSHSSLFAETWSQWLFLYSINWPNYIVWFSLLTEILDNMCIVIVCFPGCDVLKIEINFTFLIKPFFYMRKDLGYKQKIQVFDVTKFILVLPTFRLIQSSHCQGLDVEWKVYILFQNYYQVEPNSITCYKIKIS